MFINFQAVKYSNLRIAFPANLQISNRLANINYEYVPFQISDVYAALCRVLHMDNQRCPVSMFANYQVAKFDNSKTYGMKGWGDNQD
ncbi:hypothetical protein DW071_14925 [Bacteroides ovatus]|jgi:hypothetical protein|nr:hypothetical protein DW071_14925 [Bacteroides ovatus]